MKNYTLFSANEVIEGSSQLLENSMQNNRLLVTNTTPYWLTVQSQDGQVNYPNIPPFTIFPILAETPATSFTLSSALPALSTTYPSVNFSVIVSFVSILPTSFYSLDIGLSSYDPGATTSQDIVFTNNEFQLLYDQSGSSYYNDLWNPGSKRSFVFSSPVQPGLLLLVFETTAVIPNIAFNSPWLNNAGFMLYPFISGQSNNQNVYMQTLAFSPPLANLLTYSTELISPLLNQPQQDGSYRFRLFNVNFPFASTMNNNTNFTNTLPIVSSPFGTAQTIQVM